MLFRKKIERSCAYCLHGVMLEENQILCKKKGLVSNLDGCCKFRYDPLKRTPPRKKALNFSKYEDQDFSL